MPRVKNNLSTFDIDQIEADLLAVEAETLQLNSQAEKLEVDRQNVAEKKSINGDDEVISSASFKPHPVNVVNFNPDNSKLLHRVLRTDRDEVSAVSSVPDLAKGPSLNSASNNRLNSSKSNKQTTLIENVDVKKPSVKPLTVSVKAPKSAGYGMDGFKKAPLTAFSTPKPTSVVNSVALTGMKRANQFNRYVTEQHGTNLQNQLEKQSLFAKSLDGDVEIFDKGLQTNGVKKVYNVRRRKSMLGGVDQHNLGPGKLRRFLTYRSMRFILPVFALLFVGSYLMYLIMPSISIKVAENKSGVAVSEPSYTPEGYKLSGPIEANTGQVAMSFKNSDNAAYNVSQKVSDWDSKALLENKILKETKEYSAYTDRGLTIYVYDGKATWVNQGKVYEIELNGSTLDTEEMIRIAGSM